MNTAFHRWILILGCAAIVAPAAHGQNAVGLLRITAEPPGARILVDNIAQDPSPLLLTNVTPGVHLIQVSKDGYITDRATVKLAPGQKQDADFKLTPVTGLLLVHSTPRGAEVNINSSYKGRTPLIITDLPLGKYRMRVSAAGYLAKDLDLQLDSRVPRRLDVALMSNSGQLHIESVPPGATISVDGVSVGVTPMLLDRITTGRKQIDLALKGYNSFTATVTVESGSSNNISALLKALPARLIAISTPPGAKIYINDQYSGIAPFVASNLTPGAYTIRGELKGHSPATRDMTVGNDEATTVELTLSRNSGILELITEPAEVQVFVDGEDSGVTKAGASDLSSNPLKVEFLSQGIHRLQLTRKGYFNLEKSFAVELDKTVTLHETLKRRFIPDTVVRFRTEAGAEDAKMGAVSQKFPNGDIELETKPGIFLKIPAGNIISIGPTTIMP